ncbi:MAG: hypothetical protein LBS64_04425 [Spirochaetaceae bacterium]|jgi:hypothetical protein|nr:hypothetical protein [Spirochaetaceae bacterium]
MDKKEKVQENSAQNDPEHPECFRVTERAVFFLSLWLFSLLALYVHGNFRHFLDIHLMWILLLSGATGILLMLVLAAFFIEILVLSFRRKKRILFYLLSLAPALVLALIGTFFPLALRLLAAGNG